MANLLEGGELEHLQAQKQIQALNTELAMHADALAQVTALQAKINSTKEHAQGLVSMIDKRIAYLSNIWKEAIAKKDDNENVRIAKSAVSDPIRIGLNNDNDESFFERVNLLKDKVAELTLLDEQAAEAHKRAAEDRKTLNMAAARLEEVENRQRTLLANTDNRFSEGIDPVLSLRHSIAAIDARLSSNKATEEEKTDLEKLAKDLRIFLTGLPDDGSNSLLTNTSTGPPTELRVNFDRDVTANVNVETSSGISGTTISTNETSSSSFTTSSCPPAANSTPLADSSNKSKDSQESESINAKETSSTMAI